MDIAERKTRRQRTDEVEIENLPARKNLGTEMKIVKETEDGFMKSGGD